MRKIIRNIYNMLPQSRIIMVHHVADSDPKAESLIISCEQFQQYLSGKKIVPLAELLKAVQNGAYAITFDDALDDLYDVAYPYLKENNIPFTAFISAELIGQEGYITQDQLAEMSQDPLVTIGSHGCSHKNLTACSDEASLYEIKESKQILEKLLGDPVHWIAYPFGVAGKREIGYAKAAGYTHGFGVTPRAYNILAKWCMSWKLPRYNLSNETVGKLK